MIRFEAALLRFGEKGEKTGWTYLSIPSDLSEEINPGVRKSYRVKGKLDKYVFSGASALPMGDGSFILPVNAAMRKGIAKKEGAMVQVQLQLDQSEYELNPLLVNALKESDTASDAFCKMPRAHRNYYSKWVDAAKTDATRDKRLALIVVCLERGIGYAEMLRSQKREH
ncbi:YdeI/OmpD-associated family protein [Rurimicrobium arvi]|uniref:DUF1905 domain-containing protein n=1 Tax=Rurimicrobium arvi TaxID=2049916 RepID=A0ABP8MXH9_9BACT